MLALNLHSNKFNLQGFFYFKLFICPPDGKRPKCFGDFTPWTPTGLCHEPGAKLTTPQDTKLSSTTFENSIFVQKTDISKTAWINACTTTCIVKKHSTI